MSIKSVAKKVWNSKVFETAVDVTFGTLECLGEVLIDMFDNVVSPPEETNYYKETYDYWSSLSPVDREYYFSHNETLQDYGDRYYYNDKEQCAKSIARIAQMERRSFTNKYDRY
mgnify:CR=1 FL=1